jgi:hypothetical protein
VWTVGDRRGTDRPRAARIRYDIRRFSILDGIDSPHPASQTQPLVTKSRLPLWILLAAATISLLPFLALAQYAFPSADDYCLAIEARHGFWRMQSHFYQSWTGRYSAIAMQTVLSRWDLATLYPWFCSVTVLATLGASATAAGAICPRGTPRRYIAGAAAVAVAAVLTRLPSPTEAFFWMTGSLSYQWIVIVYLLWLALLIRLTRTDGAHAMSRIGAVLLTLILPGFNEVVAPVVIGTIALFVIWRRSSTGRTDWFLLTLLLITIVLTAVSFAAPGNAERSRSYPDIPSRHNLEFAVIETLRQTARFVGNFGPSAALWLATIAVWLWGPPSVKRIAPGKWWLAAALVAPLAVVYVTLFPLYWEYGAVNYTGEGRTYNITFLAFWGTLAIAALAVLGRASQRWPALDTLQAGSARDIATATALALVILFSPATAQAYRTLRSAPEYLRAQQAREFVLKAPHNHGKPVTVDALSIRPAGLYWGGLDTDAGHWINSCVADYYGLRSVRKLDLSAN